MCQVKVVCPFSLQLQQSRRQYYWDISYMAWPIFTGHIWGSYDNPFHVPPFSVKPLEILLTYSYFRRRMVSRDIVAVIVFNGSLNYVRESDMDGVLQDWAKIVVGFFVDDVQTGAPPYLSGD